VTIVGAIGVARDRAMRGFGVGTPVLGSYGGYLLRSGEGDAVTTKRRIRTYGDSRLASQSEMYRRTPCASAGFAATGPYSSRRRRIASATAAPRSDTPSFWYRFWTWVRTVVGARWMRRAI
jgi:hypothetical protein